MERLLDCTSPFKGEGIDGSLYSSSRSAKNTFGPEDEKKPIGSTMEGGSPAAESWALTKIDQSSKGRLMSVVAEIR